MKSTSGSIRSRLRALTLAILLTAAAAILAACSGGGDGDASATASAATPAAPATATATLTPAPTAVATATASSPPEARQAGGPGAAGAAIDSALTRDDVDCSAEVLADHDPQFVFTTAHYVVDGKLGAVCLGDEDPRLTGTWTTLSTITPAGALQALVLFGGFTQEGGEDDPAGETLAFVNPVGALDGTQFQMSINLPAAEADEAEARLTMAHELSHVFTATPDQLDRESGPVSCDTYFNGQGCYLAGAYLLAWIDAFWPPELLDQVDPEADDPAGADARCSVDAGFLGPYAATSPEEDFAESFSAFVFDVPVDGDELAEKARFFARYPELADFRERAEAAGLTPEPNRFEPCG